MGVDPRDASRPGCFRGDVVALGWFDPGWKPGLMAGPVRAGGAGGAGVGRPRSSRVTPMADTRRPGSLAGSTVEGSPPGQGSGRAADRVARSGCYAGRLDACAKRPRRPALDVLRDSGERSGKSAKERERHAGLIGNTSCEAVILTSQIMRQRCLDRHGL